MVTDSVGQVAALPAQLIAEPRELLLPGQVLPAGADPLIAPDDSVRGHGRCSFPRVARPARRGARAGFPFGRSKPTAGTVSALLALEVLPHRLEVLARNLTAGIASAQDLERR